MSQFEKSKIEKKSNFKKAQTFAIKKCDTDEEIEMEEELQE